MGMLVLGIVLIVYGVFCGIIALFKIPVIWNMAKIQGFRKILGDVGTQIFITVWGLAALGFGIWFVTW